MQDYFIEKLKRVSFDRTLFLKEFQKSRRWLKQDELDKVEQWARLFHHDKLEQTGPNDINDINVQSDQE
ncbi:MAG: hypothetical protein FD166_308 [Bacteroidetes bacterium]|jgi:hypothetical protein|nr:MAG: hypothetical protein FD166_308 [Bacteroidota bacterium]